MKHLIHTIENEFSKWFRRFFGIMISLFVLAIFFVGLTMMVAGVVQPTNYSILLFLLGVGMVMYSSKSIDMVLIKFGYKKDNTVSSTRKLKAK
tara:strand:+ start:1520 stop:1798 length:279 start_codon:yes stop_codon:yes gene_type:complete